MRYSGIQPQYFPRLHYFARLINTDVFLLRNDAQFLRKHKYPNGKTGKSFQAHAPIKTADGEYLLSLSAEHNGFIPIFETKISYGTKWSQDHLKAIKLSYFKSPNFIRVYEDLEKIFNTRFKTVDDLNSATLAWGLLYLLDFEFKDIEDLRLENINKILNSQDIFRLKKIIKATETKALKDYKKFDGLSPNEKIITLCREVGASEDYCGGTGARAYLEEDIFKKNGIKVTIQDWKCAEYPQLFTKQAGFIPNLSIIDLLMNVERRGAIDILKG